MAKNNNVGSRGQEKHVFLMQVHKEAKMFERILNKLVSPNHYFAINIDIKSREYEPLMKIAKSFDNVIYVTNNNIKHGGFSQIACTVEQLKYTLSYGIKFDYFHTISGQDYPCVNMNVFDDFFASNKKSYMHMDSDEEIGRWRYTKYKERLVHYFLIDMFHGKSKLNIKLFWMLNHFLKYIPRECNFLDRVCGGWNWFSLHRNVIEYIIKYLKENPTYYNRFKYTYCCDEIIFSTMLYPIAEEYNIDIHNSLRFVEWHPKRPYESTPLVLNMNEYDDIVKSGAFFCRKCEWKESLELLNKLDEHAENYKPNDI